MRTRNKVSNEGCIEEIQSTQCIFSGTQFQFLFKNSIILFWKHLDKCNCLHCTSANTIFHSAFLLYSRWLCRLESYSISQEMLVSWFQLFCSICVCSAFFYELTLTYHFHTSEWIQLSFPSAFLKTCI